jgi:hypothetical protein
MLLAPQVSDNVYCAMPECCSCFFEHLPVVNIEAGTLSGKERKESVMIDNDPGVLPAVVRS